MCGRGRMRAYPWEADHSVVKLAIRAPSCGLAYLGPHKPAQDQFGLELERTLAPGRHKLALGQHSIAAAGVLRCSKRAWLEWLGRQQGE